MTERWTAAEANQWYSEQGWLRGCNFIGSDCVNRLDLFQMYGSEEKLQTADRELELCRRTGFNTVRLWAAFEVYYAEPVSYMEIFERYIELCHRHGLKVMVVLTHEEYLPCGEKFVPAVLGPQTYERGVHQGISSPRGDKGTQPPRHFAEYEETRELFYQMIQLTVRRYADDPRIICWNVYNEPGFTLPAERAMPILRRVFETVRAEDPIQPLCADIWSGVKSGRPGTPTEQLALELSDVISFHSYAPLDKMAPALRALLQYGRPVMLTEWLHRINRSDVMQIYPFLYYTGIACYCWGFVVGPTQTNEPWEAYWDMYDQGKAGDWDFTKWQHDLYRANYRPYDPREIELIKRLNSLADKEGR